MPLPTAYRHASKDWRAFLDDVKDRLGLDSDNSAYTVVDAVLQVFRRRLTPAQGIAFADVLPGVLRAIFVYRWDVASPPVPFGTRQQMTREAQAVRPHHNLTPDHCIAAVAWALRRHVRQADLDRILAAIGPRAFLVLRAAGVGFGLKLDVVFDADLLDQGELGFQPGGKTCLSHACPTGRELGLEPGPRSYPPGLDDVEKRTGR